MQNVVHIGSTAGRIRKITQDNVYYLDDSGKNRRLYLSPSSKNVGFRKLDLAPWTVWLIGEDLTEVILPSEDLTEITFIFESFEAAYELLLTPLVKFGRLTLDLT